MTRRTVLSAAALQVLRAQSSVLVRLPKKVRVGIWGVQGHTGEITEPAPSMPDVEIVAVADAHEKVSGKLASYRFYSDPREMLEREKLDIVAVCNNNGERAAAILECIGRGLNVVAEKPLALNRADLSRIKRAVSDSGIKLGMLLPMRFDPPYLAIRDIANEGVIGEVAQIASQKSYKAGTREDWYKKRSTYGGSIAWIGIHMIDLMRFTSGREFRETAGFQGHVAFPDLGEMENVTASIFKLDNGGVANLRMDYLRTPTAPTHGDDRLRLAGTKGIIEYQEASGVTLMTNSEKPHVVSTLPKKKWLFVDYLDHAYNGTPTMLPLDDIYRVTEITIGAQEAADKGTTVKL
jgi:predicted dehydrogenase